MRKIIAILATAMMTASGATAQEYRYEVGAALGVSGYIGDVNDGNMYTQPGIAGGGIFRYNMNSRFAVKANLLYVGLSGDSKHVDRKFPNNGHYEFKSSVIDLGGQAEFNFLNFGMGARYKNYKRISPYMVAGVGATMAFVDGQTNFTFNIPLGAGVKYRVKIDGLSDLNGVKHGFGKNTDWYSVAMFTVTFEFGKRCVKCHYVE